MILYKIKDWSKRYENAQSRKCDQLHWLPLPARHDAERYCEMMAKPNASELFSAWIICLQVGARSEPRGSLVRSDGSPHTAETLATKTRGHKEWFQKALPYLTQIGWLEQVATDYQSTTSQLPVECESPGQEGRKEGIERIEEKEEKEERASIDKASKSFKLPTASEVTEYAKSIGFVLDGEYFIDKYTANGWMVGKSKMKDWKATVRTWKKNNFSSNASPQEPKKSNFTMSAWDKYKT